MRLGVSPGVAGCRRVEGSWRRSPLLVGRGPKSEEEKEEKEEKEEPAKEAGGGERKSGELPQIGRMKSD